MKIGILAIQGSVIEHKRALENAAKKLNLDVEVVEVRLPQDMVEMTNEKNSDPISAKLKIQGIILPGGESTTQSKLLRRYGLFDLLREAIKGTLPSQAKPLPVWGTCAGAILLANEVASESDKLIPYTFATMNISADRNAYGAQIDSFSDTVEMNFPDNPQKIEAVFIRAPRLRVVDHEVQVIAQHNGESVALQQANMFVTSFHPELTDDTSVHEYFLKMCLTN